MRSHWPFVGGLVLLVGLLVAGLSADANYRCDGPQIEILQDDASALVLRITNSPTTRNGGVGRGILLPDSIAVVPQIRVIRRTPVLQPSDNFVVDSTLVACGNPQRQGGNWIEVCLFRSWYREGGETWHASEYEVRYEFGAARLRKSTAASMRPHERVFLEGVVLNSGAIESFGQGRIAPFRRMAVPTDLFAQREEWVRIEVDRQGVQRLGYEELANVLGASQLDLIDPTTFRIFGASDIYQPYGAEDLRGSWVPDKVGAERALLVQDSGGIFGAGDAILFYSGGPKGWRDRHNPGADVLDYVEHEYSDRLAYWLAWDRPGGGDPIFDNLPLRMEMPAPPVGGSPESVRDHRERAHFEENQRMAYGATTDNWAWSQGIRRDEALLYDFELMDALPDSNVRLISPAIVRPASSGSISGADAKATYLVVGTADTLSYSWSTSQQFSLLSAPLTARLDLGPMVSGNYQLRLGNDSPLNSRRLSAELMLESFDFLYRRSLDCRDGGLEFRLFPDEISVARDVEFTVRNDSGDFAAGTLVLGTSNPLSPQILSAQVDGDSLRFRVQMPANVAPHFAIIRPSDLVAPVALSLRRPRLLRKELADAGAGYDMLVIHEASMATAAQALVGLRQQGIADHPNPRVAAIDLQDIYDQFGHGVKEPAAIRNYLKYVYEFDGRLEFVVLLGDASRDYRNRLGRDESGPEIDRCPTHIQVQYPQNPWNDFSRPYAADDWFGAFDAVPGSASSRAFIDLPELAIARLPVANATEAQALVGRIIAYETAPPISPWRNRLLLVADDEVGLASNNRRENAHVDEAECIAEFLLPPELDVDKLYLTEFPLVPGGTGKPSARQEMRQRWSDGALVVHYIGHGSPEQMADEAVFRIEDVGALTNGAQLPLFLAFSCDVAIYDSPFAKSLSEQLVLSRDGGAIATIAATQVTFIGPNEELTESFYPLLYDPNLPLDRSNPIGRAIMQAKITTPTRTQSLTQHNGQKYALLGDPALRLQSPRAMVAFQDSLSAGIGTGELLNIRAEARDGGLKLPNAGGRYFLEVRENADSTLYTMDQGDQDIGYLTYTLDGGAFFRGQGSYQNGEVQIPFRAPAVMAAGPVGRLRLLLEDDGEMYVGLLEPLALSKAPIGGSDVEGPHIEMTFANAARRVAPGARLSVVLEDSSGINALGTLPANSILLELDDSGIRTDLTSAFSLDDGSYTQGQLEYRLPDEISAGEHQLTLSAGDMLSNVTLKTVRFSVVEQGGIEISRHVPVPNPFAAETHFVLELAAPPGSRTEVDVDIHTLDGHQVHRIEGNLDGSGSLALSWDGRDRKGDELANGVYLYTVRARFQTDPPVEEVVTGRVVLMR